MSCCSNTSAAGSKKNDEIYKLVQERYSGHANATVNSMGQTASYNEKVASAFGYTKEELDAIPADSNLGVSCGNPLAKAALKEGEVYIDLGSGAGLDVFLAAKKVGPTGKAIGVDMTEDMLALARKNAAKGDYTNTEFVKAFITDIPLPDASTDCITSNCVINLVPHEEKHKVFTEIYRLLKPGGRFSVSDILAKKELPAEIKRDALMLVGCVSGASLVSQYEAWMKDAGFQDVVILDTNRDLNVYKDGFLNSMGNSEETKVAASGCCAFTESSKQEKDDALKARVMQYDFNEWVGAYQIYAVKPAAA